MKIDFKDVKVGNYVYYSYGKRCLICEIISLKSKFGPDYILSKVLKSSSDAAFGIEEFNFHPDDNAEYYTNRSDIDKILVFK